MSFKPAFYLKSEGSKPCLNGQAFATRDEAFHSAAARFAVWTAPTNYDVVESDDPVNYRWDPVRGDVHIETDLRTVAAEEQGRAK